MPAKIIDGKLIAERIREDVRLAVGKRAAKGLMIPGLATVLVGENPASKLYVSSKHKSCDEVGIRSFSHTLPADTPENEVISLIRGLNQDPAVHGILVQLPLPAGFDEEKILSAISLEKDVDGIHPINIGRLAQKGREPLFIPCTPAGIMVMLKEAGAKLSGSNAVILGRSNIVGMPISLLLVKANATVTICHSRTADLPGEIRRADIIIAAIGQAEMVKASWVKPGAIVIDVGINRVPDASKKRGYRIVGDVAYDEVEMVAGAISPVPGGVGPMTIAMLLSNTLHAAEIAEQKVKYY